MNLNEQTDKIKKLMGIKKIILENESNMVSNVDIFYHGNRKGDFPPKFRRFAGAIFLTSNINLAKRFADVDDFPEGKVFEVILKDGIKLCDLSKRETMKEFNLKDILQNMIDTNYVDSANEMQIKEVDGTGFKGYDYDSDMEFDIKDKSQSVYSYLWRIKNGGWRIIECEPIINEIKKRNYDGFSVTELGNKNVAIFNENNIHSWKTLDN
jgi:hypothetical protein